MCIRDRAINIKDLEIFLRIKKRILENEKPSIIIDPYRIFNFIIS